MAEISSNNLGSHYTTQAKVEIPKYSVADAPDALPKYHTFDDVDANKRIEGINTDIYEGVKGEKGAPVKKFWKNYLYFVGAVLAFLGIRKLFK